MDERRFEKLKAAVAQVDAEQCVELEVLVKQVAARRQGEIAVARRVKAREEGRCCPRCGHHDVVLHGRDKAGRQRFRCRRSADGGCGRTFNALTGTPFSRMRMPAKWAAYARLLDGFMSIDDIVETGIGISRLTAWRWRHRMLRAQVALQAAQVEGVIEADETFFRTSYKGDRSWKRGARRRTARRGPALAPGLSGEQVPVLTALDRSGGVIEAVLADRAGIATALNGLVAEGSVVCSDELKAYVEVAVRHGSEHRCIEPPRKDWVAEARLLARLAADGLGHANAHHERLKTFINRELCGVSTRYLPNYLGWTRAMRRPGFGPPALRAEALAA